MAEWISVKEAAIRLNISERNVRYKIQANQLKSKRNGKFWLVHSSLLTETEETIGNPEGFQVERGKFEEIVGILKEQITEKDKQINTLQSQITEMETSRQRTDTIIMQLTRQLENSQRMLEAPKEPFWRRWFRRKAGE